MRRCTRAAWYESRNTHEPRAHDRARLEALHSRVAAWHAIGSAVWLHSGGGTEIPTFLSYATEKKLAKDTDKAEFGTVGAIEGVAGPEAANNATVTAAMIPLLTLGIPTSNTTAVLLGAFQNYGIQPGPQLFTTSATLVWALIASLYIGNVMLLVLNLPMVGLWVKLLKIPKPQLYAGILIFATVGPTACAKASFDLFLLYGIGLLGLVLMRRFDFPTAPVVVGMILGPLAEAQMRNAVSIGEGSALGQLLVNRANRLPQYSTLTVSEGMNARGAGQAQGV
jgi:putative tricarboxylic transport membrane protein